ncbi:major capsid protein [Shouchella lonarensis]|uniref:Phage major capsid protein E n=1 Tax=Shouchella lonarensis TaxID=1464122 RepID=A0A1G6HQR3_9BACI|nr:major capsid protein [Shouchella lonarensis]SDB96483.1 Phage major capsid protein E [Shouchella lonarensis]
MATVEELLGGSRVQEYVQQRQYPLTLGDALFPPEKTEEFKIKYIMGANHAPVAANVHSYDTEAQVGSRDGAETIEMELALIKRKIQVKEELLSKLAQSNRQPEIDRVISTIYNDVDHMVQSVLTRVEAMRLELIGTGKIQLSGNGVNGEVDYGIGDHQRAQLKENEAWNSPDSDPLRQLDDWANSVTERTGVRPTRALTSTQVINALRRHPTVSIAMFGSDSGRLVSLTKLNDFLQLQNLPIIATDDRMYRVQKNDGTYENRRFFPSNSFVLLPDGTLGTTFYGVTAEEIEMRNMTGSVFQNFGNIIAQTYSTNDPVARWTKAVAKALPSFPLADQVFIGNVLDPDIDPSSTVTGVKG